jgi:hypothetical protein
MAWIRRTDDLVVVQEFRGERVGTEPIGECGSAWKGEGQTWISSGFFVSAVKRELGNECSSSMKCFEILEKIDNWQFLKEG